MSDKDFQVVVHLMPTEDHGDDLVGALTPVVSRPVSVVYPPSVIPALVDELEVVPSLQVALNQNVAEIRTEYDALAALDELGLLPRTAAETATRYIDSTALLKLRSATVQKAYENMFRCALKLLAISELFKERTGEPLPIAITSSPLELESESTERAGRADQP